MPIFLYMLAGALVAGGSALFSEANQEAARRDAIRLKRHEHDMLAVELEIDELRKQARARGLDPDLAVLGALELSSNRIDVDDVLKFMSR